MGRVIVFDQGGVRFNYRVVAVVVDRGRALLHRWETDDFWALPGGRGELLEPSRETLRREMREEMGVDVRVERLLWVVENFFDYQEKSWHELALYFLTSLLGESRLYGLDEFPGDDEGVKLLFKWFPVEELEGVPLFPTFLRQALKAIPLTTEHVVHRDGA